MLGYETLAKIVIDHVLTACNVASGVECLRIRFVKPNCCLRRVIVLRDVPS